MKKEIWLVISMGLIIVVLLGILFWPTPDVQEAGNFDVKVFSPSLGQEISSPLEVTGEARGTYFFEGSFPIRVEDASGNILGVSFVQAQGEWMTESFVAFKGNISFSSKDGGNGFLIFVKDNPSGLQENDKEFRIPVVIR